MVCLPPKTMVYCKCSPPIRGIRPVYWGMSTHLPATFGVLQATRVEKKMVQWERDPLSSVP